MDSFQDILSRLKTYWGERGVILQEPFDVEVGAGTMCPETFLRVLGPKPYRVGYVQPSRRPNDGRYGDNPNRLFKHQQYQVILKPTPDDIVDQYMASLEAVGIDLAKHDIKLEEDNWESPTLGAWGIGWQVMLDGLEITRMLKADPSTAGIPVVALTAHAQANDEARAFDGGCKGYITKPIRLARFPAQVEDYLPAGECVG